MCNATQDQLIVALLEARSLSEAARRIGVSRATGFRMAKRPGFQEAFSEARRTYRDQLVAELARQRANQLAGLVEADAGTRG
jgi:DNA-binding MurR/RpiR family transcriptional regulator